MKKMSYFIVISFVIIAGYSLSSAQTNEDSPIRPRTVYTGSKDSIYFEENSAEIKDIYKANLDSIVYFFKNNTTGTLLIHSYEHEFEVGKTATKRAAAIKEYLEKAGVPSAKLIVKVYPTMLAQHEDAKFRPGEKEELRKVVIQILH